MKITIKNSSIEYKTHTPVSLGTITQYSTRTDVVRASFNHDKCSSLNYQEGNASVKVGCNTSSKVSLLEGKTFKITVYKGASSGATLTEYTGLYGQQINVVLPTTTDTYQILVDANIEGVGEAVITLEVIQ